LVCVYIYNKITLNIKYKIGEPTIFSNKFEKCLFQSLICIKKPFVVAYTYIK